MWIENVCLNSSQGSSSSSKAYGKTGRAYVYTSPSGSFVASGTPAFLDLSVSLFVLAVVASPFQSAPLINGHMSWFSLGYHSQAFLRPDISQCSPYHTRKHARCESC
jgi:hypothetical protein